MQLQKINQRLLSEKSYKITKFRMLQEGWVKIGAYVPFNLSY